MYHHQMQSSPSPGHHIALTRRIVVQSYCRIVLLWYCLTVVSSPPGGSSKEKSLSVSIDGAGSSAKWNCFRATCGFAGGTARKDPRGDSNGLVPLSTRKKKQVHQPVVRPQVELRPLTEEMVAFFASRGISKETLERNKVRISISARRAIGVRLACDWRAIGVRLACDWRAIGVRLTCA